MSKKINQINPNKESGGKQPYQQNRIYDTDAIAPALCANKSDLLIVDAKGISMTGDFTNRKLAKSDKAYCLAANPSSDMKPMVEIFAADYRSDEGIRIRENGKAPTLTRGAENSGTQYNSLAIIGPTIRRLTPIECERLQTVADNYTNHVSDSQRYKMLGNGWTVDVIAHIFSYLKNQ